MEGTLYFIAGFVLAIVVPLLVVYAMHRAWWIKTKQGRWIP